MLCGDLPDCITMTYSYFIKTPCIHEKRLGEHVTVEIHNLNQRTAKLQWYL